VKNPFEFGRTLTAHELVDRVDELAEVTSVLLSSSKLFLIGPRRFGKTSILRAAEHKAELKGAVVLRMNAEAFPTLTQLAERLLAEGTRRLTPTMEKASSALRDVFSGLRPEISIDSVTGDLSVSLATTHGRKSIPQLIDVLDGIERLASRAKIPVAIIFDEFQKVIEDGGPTAEAQLRAVVQNHRHVAYVFAGSKTRMLADMTTDPNRPFYKLGSTLFLGAIPRDDFSRFISRGFAGGDIDLDADAIDAIFDAAEDVPYNIQLLAHACWDRCRESVGRGKAGSARMKLTSRMVVETRDWIASRSDPIYTELWTRLSSIQQRALLALLRERGVGLFSVDVSRRYDVGIATLAKSLRLLETKGIIRAEQAHGATRLRLEDPFFGAWIALTIPR
jgi:AAA+ ATPase superfamily predicted ATPase